jgi:hypothetical protein
MDAHREKRAGSMESGVPSIESHKVFLNRKSH